MAPRAENPNSLSGPTGPSLLDQSNATPADINPEIFKSRNPERQPTEGTVSSDYLKRTREEDPWPAESSCAPKTNTPAKTATVTLSDCRIDTPTEDLATDQPFQMSCQATTTDGSPLKGDIRFKLYCTLPDGTEEFTNHTVIGKRDGERYSAEGTLFSPKKPVEWGAIISYRVVATHNTRIIDAYSMHRGVAACGPWHPEQTWDITEAHFYTRSSILRLEVRGILEAMAHLPREGRKAEKKRYICYSSIESGVELLHSQRQEAIISILTHQSSKRISHYEYLPFFIHHDELDPEIMPIITKGTSARNIDHSLPLELKYLSLLRPSPWCPTLRINRTKSSSRTGPALKLNGSAPETIPHGAGNAPQVIANITEYVINPLRHEQP